MDELLAKAAEAMSMPESMVRRSAEARAKAEDRSIEEVLAEWAGVEVPDADDAPSDEPAPTEATEEEAEPTAEEPADEPEPTGIDRYVAIAAEKMKMPESMIRRSGEARARAEGRSFEEVLADWAEVDADEVKAAAAETPEPTEEADAAPAAAEASADEAEPEAEPADTDGAAEPEEATEGDTDEAAEEAEEAEERSAEPEVIGDDDEPAPDEADEEPELVASGTGLPRWLMTLFVIVPAFAIGYAAFFPNGPNCGDAGRLAVDPVTGIAVECDGSAYGERVTDFLAMGSNAYAVCAGCHGDGGGGGAGPAFTGGELLATFPAGQCEAQVEWTRVGSDGWPDPTYGATNKPVGGFGAPMPGFGGILDEDELRAVVLYERVQFGGEDLQTALVDCGLVDDENGEDPVASP